MTSVPSLLYSELESELRSSVRDLLTDHADWDRVMPFADGADPYDAKLWQRLVSDLGLAGLAVDEASEGAGASWREASVVCEEIGRTVAPVPFLTSAVAATALVQAVGATSLLAELAGGRKVAAVALSHTTPWWAPDSVVSRSGAVVDGVVPLAAGVLEADTLLVLAGDAIVAVEAADARIAAVPSLDMTRRVADVEVDGVQGVVLAEGPEAAGAVERAGDIAGALLSAEQLGLAERCLAMTVEYVSDRRQFGRTIGSYQAVKHRLADVWTDIMRARAASRYAVACAAEGSDDLAVAASVAQSVCSDVAQRAAQECVQLHGGIGFTWEHPAHLLLKRARADALAFGTPTWHRRRIASLTGLAPAPTTQETR